MPRIDIAGGLDVHCYVDDFSRPWEVATPALLLHAYGRHGRFWDAWVPRLADRRAVYRPEVPGCGRSTTPPVDHVFDVGDLLAAMITVLDHFGLERVHWVGEASGGMVGLLMALEHPDRVASLVLCNTSAQLPADKRSGSYTLGASSPVAAIREHGVEHWVRETIGGRVDTAVASPSFVQWMIEELGRVEPHVAIGLFELFGALNLYDDLPQIATPTLLLSGADCPVAAHHRELVTVLANARARAIPGCGQGVNYVFPEACVAETLRFWDDVARHDFGPGSGEVSPPGP